MDLKPGLLHEEGFGKIIKKYFPDAGPLALYGAGVTFHRLTGVMLSVMCCGRTVDLRPRITKISTTSLLRWKCGLKDERPHHCGYGTTPEASYNDWLFRRETGN